MLKSQDYLNQNYPKSQREQITELNLSGWNEDNNNWEPKANWEKLSDELDLSDFPNLEKINCSFNKITSLNLTNCPKLTEIKCWDNEIKEIKFPRSLLKLETFYAWNNNLTQIDWNTFNSKYLTDVSISNNDLQEQSLNIFNKFANLKELYLGTDTLNRLEERKCNRFYGSLRSLLESCNKLRKLQIEGTGVDEDLKHLLLPKNLEIISWHKQNDKIAQIIPLERLYVIRSNINQFLNKWGEKVEYNWYESNYWKNNLDKPIALSRLKNPADFTKQWWLVAGIQWASRATSVAGGSLVFVGQSDTENPNSQLYTQVGGVIAIASPFVEIVTSYVNDKIYDAKLAKWDEFLADAQIFLDNYNELLGILGQFEKSNKLKGSVNKSIKILNEKVKEFLDIYDGEWDEKKDGEISVNELVVRRSELVNNLSEEDNKVKEIVNSIKELEQSIIEYRKFSYYEETLLATKINEQNNNLAESNEEVVIKTEDNSSENEELIAQLEITINKN